MPIRRRQRRRVDGVKCRAYIVHMCVRVCGVCLPKDPFACRACVGTILIRLPAGKFRLIVSGVGACDGFDVGSVAQCAPSADQIAHNIDPDRWQKSVEQTERTAERGKSFENGILISIFPTLCVYVCVCVRCVAYVLLHFCDMRTKTVHTNTHTHIWMHSFPLWFKSAFRTASRLI